MRAVKRVPAIVVLALIPFAHSRAEKLPIRTYTTADGLPRDSIHKIVPDPRSYLWFCTSDGLSRFDGYEFVNYSTAHELRGRRRPKSINSANRSTSFASQTGYADVISELASVYARVLLVQKHEQMREASLR
jgi:ligand-binding sensor domain-containing protein